MCETTIRSWRLAVQLSDLPRTDRPVAGVHRQVARLNRRDFIRASAKTACAVGLAALSVVPTARRARAACGPAPSKCTEVRETTLYGACPGSIPGNCSPACGPSTVYSDVCDISGWHKTTGNYRMRPDKCNGADGWYWVTGTSCGICGCSSNPCARARCHDGCKCVGSTWDDSICRLWQCIPGTCQC